MTPRYTVNPRTPLRPSPRRRMHAQRPRVAPRTDGPRVKHTRRRVAVAVLLAQLGALAALLTLPAFQVRTVTVTGNRLLSTAQLLQAANVPSTSIFVLNADAVRARLLGMPWVASATVSTDLPGTVRITVVEQTPVLRIRRDGEDTLVAASGARFPAAALHATALQVPILLDDRIGSSAPLDPALLQALAGVSRQFTAVLGCDVAAFQWGTDGVFAVWATTGWRAVLGHLDTDQAVGAVPAQMAALAALKAHLDFSHPNFGYVDLESLLGPAVGGSPGLSPEVQAALLPGGDASQAQPGGVAPPVKTPVPAPSPTPTASPSSSASPAAAATSPPA